MGGARRALVTLARRADFLRVAGQGTKWATAGLILQACPHGTREGGSGPDQSGANVSRAQTIRVGFTASKKVGGAVVRNRARRRLKALAREVLASEAVPGYDYVLIARAETATRDYGDLRKDMRFALKRLRLLERTAPA
ncbi:MAG TPA: ribonuclease P protein component [Alphaproteobacteria bacterium]|jgi:ribonuclease P protein component